ncbi:UNKNOWN [Stylonychia lemnae]|uniref:Uncharacterized protein n=1 Tax=Stylonychia lemnae TaxID=5949 RepID=A0A078ALK6_STYLE|nr:UNKNOWN [Stylonychia lemnae]|eukprot:CDW83240.1 UNKNOWN [Stylonychia lemnae]
MEEIINEVNYMEQLYQVIGTDSQFLQFIMMPSQQIITSESSIQYMSEKLQIRSKYTMRERLKQVFTGQRKLDFIVENVANSVEYIGLTQNSGRIIVIEPQIMEQISVLEQYVLAHTSNIDLVINKSYQGRNILGRSKQYFKLITKHQLPFLFEHFLQDETDNIKPLANQYKEVEKQAKELVFLHVNEKSLGVGEKIVIHKQCVIGFQESIKFSQSNDNIYNSGNFVLVEGPGLVYIETAIIDDSFIVRNLSKREATR